jgi:hypothetical protein
LTSIIFSQIARKLLLTGGLFAVLCSLLNANWQAQWIWDAQDSETEVLLFRRSFDLDSEPDSARLRITASSLYKLYVNGEYVRRGPARSAPHHQSYDEFEIADHLTEGTNTLAVQVHYQMGTISFHHAGRAGLLAQLDMVVDGKAQLLVTDSTWRVFPDLSWDDNAPRISRFHLEVSDRVDFRKTAGHWFTSGHDDSHWKSAVPLVRTVGWPSPQKDARPQALTPPWTKLEKRDLPFLEEIKIPAGKLIQAQPVRGSAFQFNRRNRKDLPFLQSVRLDGTVEAGFTESNIQGWFLLYDFGRVLNGLPYLDIQGPAGTVVDIMCAPYVVDQQFTSEIVDSRLTDRIVLSGNHDKWEAVYFKPARYMALLVRKGNGPVQLNECGIRELSYPFALKGRLKTPGDKWFEACWEAAARTIQVCTTDAYTDNYRERRQYVQTGYYAALGNHWTFGDSALQRRYLRQAAQEQEANGMMPAYAPRHGDDFMVILDSNTSWIRGLRNYFLYSGDEETARELLPAARKLMSLLNDYTNADGLIENPPYSYWLDHALQDRRGANLCLNGHYHGALNDFADILDWLGAPGADQYRQQATGIRQTIRNKFWDTERGLFCDALVDGQQSSQFSEHGNAMALATGAATEEQAASVASALLVEDDGSFTIRESGIVMATPAMAYFLHKGLCQYGYVQESLGMLKRRFSRMLANDTNQTLWEEWWRDGTGRSGLFEKRTRSDAQTESAFPPALFGEYILGIQPVSPGMREVEIHVPRSGLDNASGTLPSPLGPLSVEWDLGSGRLTLNVPEGMRVLFNHAGKHRHYKSGQHEVQY